MTPALNGWTTHPATSDELSTETAQVEILPPSEDDIAADDRGPQLPKWDRVLLGLALVALAIALAVGLT